MSTPPPADGVKQAVRRVRMAAAAVSNPLGLFGVAVTAAEQIPALLEPELEALAPSPFSMLGGLLGSGPAGTGASGRARAARAAKPAASAPAPGPATRATEAVSILGRFVTDELVALGVTAPAPSRPQQQQQQTFGGDIAQILGPMLTAFQEQPPAPAPGGVADIVTALGAVPATRAERIGSAVAVTAAGAGAPPVVTGAAKAAATGIAAGLGLLEELVTGQRPAGDVPGPSIMAGLLAGLPEPPAPQKSAPGRTEPSRAGAAPTASQPTLDEARRRLLDPTAAAGSDPTATPVPAIAAPQDPDDLAWLVNEALVEQARRHGVDLS